MKRSVEVGDPEVTLASLKTTNLQSIVGAVDCSSGPVKNVSKTPLASGQWRLGGDFKYELVITDNQTAPSIPTGGSMEAIA